MKTIAETFPQDRVVSMILGRVGPPIDAETRRQLEAIDRGEFLVQRSPKPAPGRSNVSGSKQARTRRIQ